MINLTDWITNSLGQNETRSALAKTAVATWSARLMASLLAGDLLLILAHFLLVFTPLLSDGGFYVDRDGGYGEWFQYLKYSGAIVLLLALFKRQRAPLYLFWVALFAYLLLDDSLRLHEVWGLRLAEAANLPAVLTLRARDLGELAFSGVSGLILLTALVFTYQHSRPVARKFTQKLLLALVALAFFGIAVDMVQVMSLELLRPYPFLRELLVTIEEGGEMMVASLMVWLTYRQAERAHGWTAVQVGAWLREVGVPLASLGVVTAVLALIQMSTPALVGNDGYYHAKMALLLRQEGLDAARPLLPFTILGGDAFYNHHLLYHLYLALFTQTSPAIDGGLALTQQVKLASILMAVLPFAAIWWLLRGQGVRWPALWTLALLALSEPFLYRMSMPRAQAASLLVLVIGLHWLLKGQYRRLLPLGVVYVWLYDAFPLLLLLCGIYFTAVALTERRFLWPVLLYPTAGIVVGLVVNPYFPQNLTFIGHHLLDKLVGATAIPVGSEWYPYDTWSLVQHSGLALALFLGTLLLLNWGRVRWDARLLTLFGITAVFLLMLFRARRFIEYFPAFVLIFGAVALSPLLVGWWAERPFRHKWLLAGCTALLLLPGWHTVQAARSSVASSQPADQYAAAALWLKAYSQPDSMVFQADWDDFTRLFFYNSQARYTVGLDPTFLARYDEPLYHDWVALTRGKVAQPVPLIQEKFGADYIFSDLDHTALLAQLAKAPNVTEVYRDEYAVIFEIDQERDGIRP